MIFGLFGRKSGPVRDSDRIWQNSARKLRGVAEEAVSAPRVLVVAHFRSTLAAVAAALEAKGARSRSHTDRIATASLAAPAAYSKFDGIALALAAVLPAPAKAAQSAAEAGLVLVAEHHFLPQEDDRILRYCEGLAFPVRLRFHESLDAPLLRMFSGERTTALLAQLGMGEDEAIEHAMVDKAIRGAQEKIADTRTGERAAGSPEEWMKLNLP